MIDVVIVGGSYAGLAAALQLGRARREVLIIDGGQRRNRDVTHAHGPYCGGYELDRRKLGVLGHEGDDGRRPVCLRGRRHRSAQRHVRDRRRRARNLRASIAGVRALNHRRSCGD
jgi:2-polyprenyl-6-methoxyphenol hydroxylase-like FAD-dependent oxidoreductase